MSSNPLHIIIFISVLIAACKKDEAPQTGTTSHPNEIITTLRMALEDTADVHSLTVQYRDLDGIGGTPPTIDTLRLRTGMTYICTITLVNERVTPARQITLEIQQEASAHRFWMTVGGGIASKISVNPLDGDGSLPLGLQSSISVSSTTVNTGSLRVLLKHYDPASLKSGDRNGTLGSTDIDATFPIIIE